MKREEGAGALAPDAEYQPEEMLPEEMLAKGLLELSLDCSRRQVEQFAAYLAELKKWSKVHNLTALARDGEIVAKHFLDSLLFLPCLPPGPLTVLDAGSGAGFPGIPLKIVRPELSVHLLEPRRKKTAFLRHAVACLGLTGVAVKEGRIEELAQEEVYDAVVARALLSVADLIQKATPVLKAGGVMVVSKGPDYEKEIRGYEPHIQVMAARIPLTEITRYLIVAKKV